MSNSLIDLPHDQFEQFLDLSGDIVYQTDTAGRITYVNSRVREVLGYAPESLLGSHYLVLVEPNARAETFRFYSEQARQQTQQTYHEFAALARDGRRVWVQQHVQLLYDDDKLKGFHGVVRDVSKLAKVEQDLESRDARMDLLSRLAATTGTKTERLRQALREASQLLGLSTAILSRVNGDRYEVVQYWPDDAGVHEGQEFSLGSTYCDLVMRQGGVVAIEHMGESPHANHPCYEAFGLQSYIGAPVYVAGNVVGTINFSDPDPRRLGFSGGDTGFVALLAQWVGSLLEQSIALERIRSAEGQLRRVVAASADGVTTCAPDGRILWMNRAACEMLSLSEEPIGQDIRLFIPSYFKSPTTSRPEYRQAIQNGGTVFEIELTVTRTEHAGGSVVAGIFRDVSARNLQATKLRRREAALRAFFDGTPFLMGILGLRGNELVHLSANAAAIDFLGLLVPPSLLRDGETTETLPDLSSWKAACRRCQAERQPVRLEMEYSGRWLSVTINRIEDPSEDEARFSYVAEDVTGAHQQAEELARRTAEFEAIYASIPHAAVFANADRGIVAVNPAFTNIFGYSDEDALGLDAAFLFSDIATGDSDTLTEVTYRRSDGTEFRAETIQVPVPGPSGETLGWLALIRDVTERNTNRERLRMQANILTHVRDAVMVLDADLLVSYWNAGAAKLTGVVEADAIGHSLFEMLQLELFDPIHESEAIQALVNTGIWKGRVKLNGVSASQLIVEAVVSLMRDGRGEASGMLVVARDITDTVELESQLRLQARSDTLTKLPNRKVLDERIRQAIEDRDVGGVGFALIFIDVDRFKLVNDSLGHAVGDALLQQVAGRLQSCTEPGSLVARIGGDEFAVLLSGLPNRRAAEEQAKRLNDSLSRPFEVGGKTLPSSASLGIVLGDVRYRSPDELLRDADTAMYVAKRKAPGTAVVFSEAMHEDVTRRFELESDLAFAAERDELELVYQPIVDLSNGELSGFEALVRWRHPEMGILMPDEFLPIGAERGLLGAIDRWVLREAAAQLSCWLATYPLRAGLTMHINSSRETVLTPEYRETVRQALQEFRLPTNSIEVEITEHILLDDHVTAAKRLASLKRLGVRLSVDDFGTGYSSINLLHELPVDSVKTDRSLLHSAADEVRGVHILKTVATLSEALELGLVAEGIETEEQMRQVRELGFGYGQGYFFSKPRTGPEAEKLLRTPAWLGYWQDRGDRESPQLPGDTRRGDRESALPESRGPVAPPSQSGQRSTTSPNSGTEIRS